MVIGSAEMLRRPMAFTGTSGVVRFERDAGAVLHDIIASGLEHHMALAYGDHRATLRAVAAELGLPVLRLLAAVRERDLHLAERGYSAGRLDRVAMAESPAKSTPPLRCKSNEMCPGVWPGVGTAVRSDTTGMGPSATV